ncbi:MAG TPA: low temperature requirement protein A, partial [Acidimicrobiales bacterium]|nr:low temperature requirement protein A [Acidimicrobiales bacterium]
MVDFVMYAERFDTDDVVHRLSKAAAMFAVGAVAFGPLRRCGPPARWASLWAAVVAAALLVLCLWWLTFDFVEEGAPGGTRGLAYVYSHLPVYGGIAALGVGMQLVVESTADAPLAGPARWVLCGAGAGYLLGVAGIRASADPHPRA